MNLKIVLEPTNDGNCGISFTDITTTSDYGYLPESYQSYIPGRFKYSETISIYALQKNTFNSTNASINILYDFHELSDNKITTFKSVEDAWYTAFIVVIPSITWFIEQLDILSTGNGETQLGAYKYIYYTDGSKYYKAIKNNNVYNITEVTIQELLTVPISGTNISRETIDYVSVCGLKQCYIEVSRQILNDKNFNKCFEKNNAVYSLSYKRDLLWMAINSIEYAVINNKLADAQKIIEQLAGCNGLCNGVKTTYSQTTGNCGCCK